MPAGAHTASPLQPVEPVEPVSAPRPQGSPTAAVTGTPTRDDPLVAAASEVVGGPLGRHAIVGRRGWRPVAAVLMAASSVLVAAGVLERAPCLRSGWTTPDQFWHACYSDLPIVYQSSGLAAGVTPYVHAFGQPAHFLDQPVLSGAAMWLLALGVPDGSGLVPQRWYFGLWAILATLAVALLVLATVRSAPRRPWSAAHVALSPVLVTAPLVSVDVLGVVLTSLGLWAWSRRKVPLAGVLLGLAVSSRSYPVVVILAIGLVAVRSGRLRSFAVLAGSSALSFLVVTLPLLLRGAGQGVFSTYRTWWNAGASYGSPWQLPDLGHQVQAAYLLFRSQAGYPRSTSFWSSIRVSALAPGGVTALTVLGWLVALAAGALLALGTRRRPGVAEVAFVMLAIVVVTGKAVPPQAALWLLPLLALVGLRWRDHLIWAGMELAYFVAVWMYIAGFDKPDRGLPAGWFAAFLVCRLAVISYLVWRVVQVSWRRGSSPRIHQDERAEQLDEPDRPDVSDEPDEPDELAGPLAGSRDRVLVRFD